MDDSPLKKLPAELLKDIAERAFNFSEDGIHASFKQQKKGTPAQAAKITASRTKHPAALAETCQELKKTLMPLFWATNTIHFKTTQNTFEDNISRFLHLVNPAIASRIPGLVLEIEMDIILDEAYAQEIVHWTIENVIQNSGQTKGALSAFNLVQVELFFEQIVGYDVFPAKMQLAYSDVKESLRKQVAQAQRVRRSRKTSYNTSAVTSTLLHLLKTFQKGFSRSTSKQR